MNRKGCNLAGFPLQSRGMHALRSHDVLRHLLPAALLALGSWMPVFPAAAQEKLAEARRDEPLALFARRCVACHGQNGKVEGEVDLARLRTPDDLAAQPELLQNVLDALDSAYMPPESEPALPETRRDAIVARLKELLRTALSSKNTFPGAPVRRMNRFQYNNAVQDLFELHVEVFPLPERMLREHGNYFQPQTGKMPQRVRVGSRPLGKSQLIERRLGGVTPFPQDLRAEHGFDNRGDHLSLSPLLLESFLKLSRSIVDSPDFHAGTCGIWNDLFAPPPSESAEDTQTVVGRRLTKFLTRAFRRPVEQPVLDRYVQHVLARLRSGESFRDSMKSAASAALASPRFFYLYDQVDEGPDDRPESGGTPGSTADFNLASRLSFFLWGSIPDQALLDLAARGELSEPRVLSEQVERMLGDERVKRFCDSFPAQWLQLERIISSTPDPDRYPQFYFAKYRASMHMMLEPLLLFETVLIEDLSILQFIDSDFSYRSDLLDAWYRDGSQGKAGSPTTIAFRRVPVTDRRQGGLITCAAVMTMTSGVSRTKPITRGAWVASVILNDPPEPPPADVPPLADEPSEVEKSLTLRERFAAHRKRADCAGCHRRIDPLGFALENYDAAGIWRDTYANGRPVDAAGTLFGRHRFGDIVEFKDALLQEKNRFTRALAAHLLAFALGREVGIEDTPALDRIVRETAAADYRFRTLIKQIVLSVPFRQASPAVQNEPPVPHRSHSEDSEDSASPR